MAFGGSGGTITTFIKGNEDKGGRRHIQHHQYTSTSSYAAPIEAEAENEPQNPMMQMAGGRRERKPVVEVRKVTKDGSGCTGGRRERKPVVDVRKVTKDGSGWVCMHQLRALYI